MINNRRPRCHKHPGRRFCFADIWETAACPAENIATARSPTLIQYYQITFATAY